VATDEELMTDLRGGSREALEALFQRYREPIWGFFRRRVPDRASAEELTQDAFVAILEGAGRYEARGPFRSNLFGVAYNILSADRRHRAARATAPLEDVAAPPGNPDASLWIQAALASLDAGDRELLMLREYEQLSYEEIAHLQAIPLNTVRSRLFRARLALKRVLEARTTLGAGHAAR
jgi:RNA polymerase sigma-70 factor (ECF subfamily)